MRPCENSEGSPTLNPNVSSFIVQMTKGWKMSLQRDIEVQLTLLTFFGMRKRKVADFFPWFVAQVTDY